MLVPAVLAFVEGLALVVVPVLRLAQRAGQRLRALTVAALLASIVVGPAAAVDGDGGDPPPRAASGEERAAAPDENEGAAPSGYEESVVVTATKTPTPIDRIGSSITVVGVDDALPLSGRLALDVLRGVPGLDVRRTGGPGSTASVFLRGADADHTLILVDGIAVNDPSTPSRTAFVSHLTLDGVERIEVLRGPQSPLYGGDAIGGVVNILTGGGKPDGRLDLWSEAGSYSTVAGGLSWADRVGAARIAVSGSQLESGGFSASSSGREDDPYRNATLGGTLTAPLGSRAELAAALRYIGAEADFDGFAEETGHRIDSRQLLARLAPELQSLSGRWTHRFGFEHARHRRVTSGLFPSDVAGTRSGASWNGVLTPTGRQTLLFGAELEREQAELTSMRSHARSRAAYLQEQLAIGTRWFATLGARYDDHSAFGSKLTYRAAASYRAAADGLVLRASLGTGFKAPSLVELDPRAFGGNPDLAPETAFGVDAGAEYALAGGRTVVGATVFANRFDRLIVSIFDPSFGAFVNANIDTARARGLELYATAALGRRIDLRGQYTLTDSEALGAPAGFGLTDRSPLLRRPRHKGSLSLACRIGPRRGDRLFVDLVRVGARNDVDPATFAVVDAPGYVVVNAAASYRVTGALTLRGRIENLLDERYEDVLGFGTPGRSGYLGIGLAIDTR